MSCASAVLIADCSAGSADAASCAEAMSSAVGYAPDSTNSRMEAATSPSRAVETEPIRTVGELGVCYIDGS